MGNKPKLKSRPSITAVYFGDERFSVGDTFRIRGELFMVNNFVPEQAMMNLVRLSKSKYDELKKLGESHDPAKKEQPEVPGPSTQSA